jgi:hypothetical protein
MSFIFGFVVGVSALTVLLYVMGFDVIGYITSDREGW